MSKENIDKINSILLSEKGYIPLNKQLIKAIGLHEAIVYAEFVSVYLYFAERNELNKYDEFWCTFPKLEQVTTLSKRQQTSAITNLVNLGLIEVTNRVPYAHQRAVRHIKIIDKPSILRNLLKSDQGEAPLE